MEDIILWPDGTYCDRSELHHFTFMSDDYEVLAEGSEAHYAFCLSNDLIELA